jgi:hypothetical protein
MSSILIPKNLKIKTDETINLTVVLYGCETCPLMQMEEDRLRVLRIFGPKRVEMVEDWRRLHN